MEETTKIPFTTVSSSVNQGVDLSKCLICQETKYPKNKHPLSKATKDGLSRIRICSKVRKSCNDESFSQAILNVDALDNEAIETLVWHRSCYCNFTSKGHLDRLTKQRTENKDEPVGDDQVKRRSSIDRMDWSKCMFCQDSKRQRPDNLNQVQTTETSENILSKANQDPILCIRLAGVNDLIASEGKYHLKCYVKFKRDTNAEKLKYKDEEDAVSECFNNVMSVLEAGLSQGNVYSLKAVWQYYAHKLESSYKLDPGLYRSNRFKPKVMSFLENKVSIINPLNPSESPLLIPSHLCETAAHSLLQCPSDFESQKMSDLAQESLGATDSDAEHLSWLFRVSVKLNQEIKESEGHNTIGNLTLESAEKVVPEKLYVMIRLLCGWDINDEGDENVASYEVKKKILSICQDIVFLASKGRKLTPKHIGLGLTVHQATRSKELVQLLYEAGHCVSYDSLLRIDTSIANDVLQRYNEVGKIFVPRNIQECDEPCPINRFAVDNIDINEETLSGLGTFHATQITTMRRMGQDESHVSLKIEPSSTKKLDLEVPSELHDLQPAEMRNEKQEPVIPHPVSKEWYDPDPEHMSKSFLEDLVWLVARQNNSAPELQKVPGWTGFNQLLDKSNQQLTVISPLPILNATAHEFDTLWTVIVKCLAASRLLQGKFTVITLDEALYCKAKLLQFDKYNECKSLVLMLGGFHIQMSFSKVIGKFIQSSGIADIWTESEVYGETTATNILQGKNWNRVIRAHKLTLEALWRILWPLLVTWCNNEGRELDRSYEDLKCKFVDEISQEQYQRAEDTFVDLTESLTPLLDAIQAFDAANSENGTFMFWRTYMGLVCILLRFTRALRIGNWDLFLSSFAEMLPWFAIFDHVNYTRWGIIFLADMRLLPKTAPDVYRSFQNGEFVSKESRNKFNQVPDDQALEHVNKTGKIAGGLVGITRTDTARDRWCLTYNERAILSDETKAMFRLKKEDDNDHKDGSSSRMRRDEEEVQRMVVSFQRYNVFRSGSDLVVITTGDVASDDIKNGLLNAQATGIKLVKTFVEERLIQKNEKFHGTIRQQKLKTLESMYIVPVQVDKTTTVPLKADRDLFRRLIVALESQRDIDIDSLLEKELSPVPLSLATLEGNLRIPSNKADLSQILQADAVQSSLPPNEKDTCLIIDGMAAVQTLGNRCGSKTFGEWNDNFQQFIVKHFSEECTRIDVVFDRYLEHSIKGNTRTKRRSAKLRGIKRNVENRQQKIGNWEKFIVLDENKASLTNFLSQQLQAFQCDPGKELVVSGGFANIMEVWSSSSRDTTCLSSDHEEADTRILLHCKDAALRGYQQVNIMSRDTDVLVLLVAHRESLCPKIWMFSGTSRKRSYTAVHNIKIESKEIQQSLLAFHALTGCDTTSQFVGIGKLSAWKVFVRNPELLQNLGENTSLAVDDLLHAEKFVCKLYDKGANLHMINKERARLFRTANLDSLPPTQDALHLHIKRAHFQTFVWKKALQPSPILPSLENSGWYFQEGSLRAHLMTRDPVSAACLQLAFCGCTAQGSSCRTRRCTCVRLKLTCTKACKCGDSCHNNIG